MSRVTAVLLSLAVASLAFVWRAQGAGASVPSPPPRVSATDWIPITQNLGFIISEGSELVRNPQPKPSVRGYFVSRQHGGWLRLDSIPQVARLRWPLVSGQPESRLLITRNLQFVTEQPTAAGGTGWPSAAVGYFVVERDGHWVRLDPISRGALLSAPLTAGRRTPSLPITDSLSFLVQLPTREGGGAQLPSVFGCFVLEQNGRSLNLSPIAVTQDELLR